MAGPRFAAMGSQKTVQYTRNVSRMKWIHSLVVQIPAIFVALLLILMASLYFLLETQIRKQLEEQAYRMIDQSGDHMVSQLNNQLLAIEALTTALATTGEVITEDSPTTRHVLSKIISHRGAEGYIAGGGIWPEPFAFDKSKERSSFFWGRNQEGALEYYDNYNDPEGTGYHREEWYVPVRHLPPGKVYWSKSYSDPYSFEPMVTCSAPMFRESEFIGVATIDLKLSGLNELFEQLHGDRPGFAFAVDRNGKLLSSPDFETDHVVDHNHDYLNISELGALDERFQPIAEQVQIIRNTRNRNQTDRDPNFRELAGTLAKSSEQINFEEALTIAALLRNPSKTTDRVADTFILEENDLFENSAIVSIYQIPDTYWSIVSIVESDHYFRKIQSAYHAVLGYIVMIFVAAIAIVLWLIFRHYVLPLRKAQRDLAHEYETHGRLKALPENRQDEIGTLFHSLNLRSNQLERSLFELTRAKEQAQNANNAKSAFLTTMTHEIRTPLNGVTGYANLLTDTELTEQQSEYTQAIISNSSALLYIVEDILDLSKIESNRIDLEIHTFRLQSWIDELIQIIRPQAEAKGLEFGFDCPPNLPELIETDATRLRQIVINLASNAVKFTEKGGVYLQLRCQESAKGEAGSCVLEFTVNDTGIGIAQENQAKLFDPFTQADASTYRQFGGSGLGLAICKKLTEMLGGQINLYSEAGTGSQFTFTIRAKVVPETKGKLKTGHENKISNFKGWATRFPFRILVAEDNLTNQKLIGAILKKMGYDPVFAHNGREALETLQHESIDLILMDNLMPEMDGFEATREIRAGNAGVRSKDIPIIAITANAFKEAREEAVASGMDAFLTKPIKIAKLAHTIQEMAEKYPAAKTPAEKTVEVPTELVL